MSLSFHVALVIGASRGIGRAVSIALAQQGISLILTARDKATLDAVADECKKAAPVGSNIRVLVHAFDATDFKRLKSVIDDSAKELGRISLLFCNAGINRRRKAQYSDPSIWEQVVSINLISPMYATAYALPHLLKSAQETDQDSVIIYNSSIAVRNEFGDMGLSSYFASKSGLNAFAACVRVDLIEQRVKVCCLNPGLVNTDLGTRPRSGVILHPEKMIQAEDIVDTILYIIRTKKTVVPHSIDLHSAFIPYSRSPPTKKTNPDQDNKNTNAPKPVSRL